MQEMSARMDTTEGCRCNVSKMQEPRMERMRCFYCELNVATSTDHFIPRKYNGKKIKANVLPSCKKCNSIKSSHVFTDLEMAKKYISETNKIPNMNFRKWAHLNKEGVVWDGNCSFCNSLSPKGSKYCSNNCMKSQANLNSLLKRKGSKAKS